jgi:hypothetical protein
MANDARFAGTLEGGRGSHCYNSAAPLELFLCEIIQNSWTDQSSAEAHL